MTLHGVALGLSIGWPVVLLLLVLAWRERRERAGIQQRLRMLKRVPTSQGVYKEKRRSSQVSSSERWRRGPQAAALRLRRSEYLLFRMGSLALPGVAGFLMRGPLGGLILALAGFVGVTVYFRMKQQRWLRQCEDSLPGFLRGVASALRAGSSLSQAMALVARETEDPLGGEILRVMRREMLGFNLVDILQELTHRIPSRELELAVVAIVIQREVGGSLAKLLDNIVSTIVDRQRLRREIQVLTAQGRYSGMVLTALPFLLGAAIVFFNPSYMTPLFTSLIGWGLSAGALIGVVIGGFMIHRMVQAPEM